MAFQIIGRHRNGTYVDTLQNVRVSEVGQSMVDSAAVPQVSHEHSNIVVRAPPRIPTGSRAEKHNFGDLSGHGALNVTAKFPEVHDSFVRQHF